MAKGKSCRKCGHNMYAIEEKDRGTCITVVYECRNQKCRRKEKVDENK